MNTEILQLNYWEHFKFSKDLSRVLSSDHPKQVALKKAMEEMLEDMHNSNASPVNVKP